MIVNSMMVLLETMIWAYSSCGMGALNLYLVTSEIRILRPTGPQFGLRQIRAKLLIFDLECKCKELFGVYILFLLYLLGQRLLYL